MGTKILILLIVSLGTLLLAGKPQSKEQGDMTTVKSAQSAKETNTPVSDDDAFTWRQPNETRAQMNDHESIHTIAQSQTEPRTRARAEAKITVQSSEAKPYDQTASPALVIVFLIVVVFPFHTPPPVQADVS